MKIFEGNKDYNKSAFLNWRLGKEEAIVNLMNIGEGFLGSALSLADLCLANNDDKKADILIFPILHNLNHGIELYLKAMSWTLNLLNGNNIKFEETHDIMQLYSMVKAKIKKLKGKEYLKTFDASNANLAEYLDELYAKISTVGGRSKMDFSRYPLTTAGDNHFYLNTSDNVEVNLEYLKSSIEKIKDSLDERLSHLYYQELKGEW